jgi:hypothetical protein
MKRRYLTGSLLAACLACSAEATPGSPDASADVASTVDATSDAVADAGNHAPTIAPIAAQTVPEETTMDLALAAFDPDGDPLTWSVDGLPPGAYFVRSTRHVVFRPDFVQGGVPSWDVTVTVSDGKASAKASFAITVPDSVQPPDPVVTKTETVGSCTRYTLGQTTDAFLDSPGYAGRSFTAVVTVPKNASSQNRVPLAIELHGVGGAPSPALGCSTEIRIQPHDPMTTYWWGYSENLPAGKPTSGKVPPYTVRRVLLLMDWAQRTQGADRTRTHVEGGSMGGAGAMTIGLLWARHFAAVDATIGQAIPRNHRPSRLATLEALWGTRALNLDDGAGMGVWDRQDLTRVLRDEPEAAGQFVFVKHGKDDPTIHFGAVTIASPLTNLTFYQALRGHPHFAVWDEGAHGPADPLLGGGWWGSWDRIGDATAFVRLDRAVPAFSASSGDGDPGDGTGNGKVPWSAESGYAGDVTVVGDTGWKGDIAGTINRHLRWDATKIVDESSHFGIPLRVLSGAGAPSPKAGYPTKGDLVGVALPITVDVTLRRTQAFRPLPGAKLHFTFGAASGDVIVAEDGAVKIPNLALGPDWTTLDVTPTL